MLSKPSFQVVPLADVPKDDYSTLTSKRPVVLVVDDEKIIADTLSMILTKSGFHAVAAYHGLSALEMAKEIHPQLVITDIMMPMMSGIELAMEVTGVFPECRILLFSGQSLQLHLDQSPVAGMLRKAREAGHDFTTMEKPIHPAELLRRAREYFPADEFSGVGMIS